MPHLFVHYTTNGYRRDDDNVGGLVRYRGNDGRTDRDLYDIDAHFDGDGSWESFAFVGGPGAG